MPLKIAFLGYNTRLTDLYFRQLAEDNREQVKYFDGRRGVMVLHDGTQIKALRGPVKYLDGVRYDQVIIVDDRRLRIFEHRREELRYLRHVTRYTEIPEEFRFQIYDIDAEL